MMRVAEISFLGATTQNECSGASTVRNNGRVNWRTMSEGVFLSSPMIARVMANVYVVSCFEDDIPVPPQVVRVFTLARASASASAAP